MSMTSVPPFTEDLAESFTDAWSLSLSLSLSLYSLFMTKKLVFSGVKCEFFVRSPMHHFLFSLASISCPNVQSPRYKNVYNSISVESSIVIEIIMP